ncbi:Isopentenyl-diphosphate Delta-isomerase [Dyadobacter sp. CECT 9275]|uniref:Isopentenyl-diphosphate delta-isomerase n=1 Tax=Dyadobacter helix TaxID=2822344 RepID=A0A916JJQ0_9BACT|nr:isopentenyl-diphosphate Delta-isomerase [Dyadobacter sp. CECT 9275]CAG5017567.1 Isopentenyl-diphosphate Delta-isomerase [Dyadobacter sp. CECT 9275]
MNVQVVLVDENDTPVGLMPKMEAHEKGALHRAISVFIFNTEGDLLLQQRRYDKYHSGGLWTNTCCSHPLPEEDTTRAANRRLLEEMGIEAELHFLFSFQYHAALENGLTEHELDHVFWGITDQKPDINISEVESYKYISRTELLADLTARSETYTEWFKICIQDVLEKIESQTKSL